MANENDKPNQSPPTGSQIGNRPIAGEGTVLVKKGQDPIAGETTKVVLGGGGINGEHTRPLREGGTPRRGTRD